MEIIEKLKAYDSDFKNIEVLTDILSGIAFFDIQIEYNLKQSESEYAQVSKEYKEKYLHKKEIAEKSKQRLIERFFKQTNKINDEARRAFI